MAWEGSTFRFTIVGSANLRDSGAGTGAQYKAIDMVTGDVSNGGIDALGILRYGSEAAEHVTLDVFGICKYTAAQSMGPGVRLMVTTSGYMTLAVSGYYTCGRNLGDWVDSGAVGTGMFDFSIPVFMTSSN